MTPRPVPTAPRTPPPDRNPAYLESLRTVERLEGEHRQLEERLASLDDTGRPLSRPGIGDRVSAALKGVAVLEPPAVDLVELRRDLRIHASAVAKARSEAENVRVRISRQIKAELAGEWRDMLQTTRRAALALADAIEAEAAFIRGLESQGFARDMLASVPMAEQPGPFSRKSVADWTEAVAVRGVKLDD